MLEECLREKYAYHSVGVCAGNREEEPQTEATEKTFPIGAYLSNRLNLDVVRDCKEDSPGREQCVRLICDLLNKETASNKIY